MTVGRPGDTGATGATGASGASGPGRLHRRTAVLLTLAFMLGGAAMSGAVALVVRHEINDERAIDDCAQDQRFVTALRAVVHEAFADTDNEPVVLPPDPRVPPEFIEYLQDLVNNMSTGVNRTAVRDRLLARVPRIGCTKDGKPFEIPEPDRGTP